MDNKGVIYILTNPSFPQYVKIGYADNVESRLKPGKQREGTLTGEHKEMMGIVGIY